MLNKMANLMLAIFFVTAFSGCSYLSQCAPLLSYIPSLDFSGPNFTTIEIQTTKSTNHGAPFYVLVKSTDFPSFLADDYLKISTSISRPEKTEDQPSYTLACIVPGINQIVKVETPENKSLAVYCLFTNPGEAWKYIFELESECQTIEVFLGENEIISIEV